MRNIWDAFDKITVDVCIAGLTNRLSWSLHWILACKMFSSEELAGGAWKGYSQQHHRQIGANLISLSITNHKQWAAVDLCTIWRNTGRTCARSHNGRPFQCTPREDSRSNKTARSDPFQTGASHFLFLGGHTRRDDAGWSCRSLNTGSPCCRRHTFPCSIHPDVKNTCFPFEAAGKARIHRRSQCIFELPPFVHNFF